MPANKGERQSRYWLLRKAGFSSSDATRFKDLKISKIEEIINARNEYNEAERKAFAIYETLVDRILYDE